MNKAITVLASLLAFSLFGLLIARLYIQTHNCHVWSTYLAGAVWGGIAGVGLSIGLIRWFRWFRVG